MKKFHILDQNQGLTPSEKDLFFDFLKKCLHLEKKGGKKKVDQSVSHSFYNFLPPLFVVCLEAGIRFFLLDLLPWQMNIHVPMDLVRLAPRMLCGGCLPDKANVERTKFEPTSAIILKLFLSFCLQWQKHTYTMEKLSK